MNGEPQQANDELQSNWDEWFDGQHKLTEAISRAVDLLSKDKGDGFRVALYSAVIEHSAETMRRYIPDVALNAVEDQR